MTLKGKVAIVTGAGRGIGEAVAGAFAREGARSILVARTASEVVAAADAVRASGAAASAVPADVSDPAAADRIVQAAIETYGRVDILVNAAGVYGPIGPVWEADPREWVRAIEVNLFGTMYLSRAAAPHMIRQREGKIVNFSGGGATAPLPYFSAYAVSKSAVVRFTETLAEEVRSFNIQVNAIAPGAVDTRLQDAVLAAGDRAGPLFERIRRLRERQEGGVPRDLPASLAVFLASPASNGLTGKLIAAPYDGWQTWDAAKIADVMTLPWFTLRRLDPATIRPFLHAAKTE
ncbi:MAG TPA: SDR family oxidoreductase [bacterium]|nr:SDR family oxidoreductase [bacterium]